MNSIKKFKSKRLSFAQKWWKTLFLFCLWDMLLVESCRMIIFRAQILPWAVSNAKGTMRYCEVTQKFYEGGIFHVTVNLIRVVLRLTLLFNFYLKMFFDQWWIRYEIWWTMDFFQITETWFRARRHMIDFISKVLSMPKFNPE